MKTEKEKQKIQTILSARRALYRAGVELLECDDIYAGRIKTELERHAFADNMVLFADGKEIKKRLDEDDVLFYLEMHMRIYVRAENIMIDRQKNLCRIKLNDRNEAVITIKNGTTVNGILFKGESALNLRETEEYKSGMCSIVICPVCGKETLDMYHICEECGWEYDHTTDENDVSSANGMTLKEYREMYRKKKAEDPSYTWSAQQEQ